MTLVALRVHHRNVPQITVELLKVESAADHESIRNLEASKIDRDLHDAAYGAIEERADSQRPGAAAGQRLQEIARCETGIDDVFDQQHVFVLNRLVQILGDAHHALRPSLIVSAKTRNRE